jgi:hypothetical protein
MPAVTWLRGALAMMQSGASHAPCLRSSGTEDLMFRTGVALTIVGLAAVAIGTLAIPSMTMPLPGGWHSTVFPRGVGVLILVAGVGLVVLSAVERYVRERSNR